jgi:hypothetical protein
MSLPSLQSPSHRFITTQHGHDNDLEEDIEVIYSSQEAKVNKVIDVAKMEEQPKISKTSKT